MHSNILYLSSLTYNKYLECKRIFNYKVYNKPSYILKSFNSNKHNIYHLELTLAAYIPPKAAIIINSITTIINKQKYDLAKFFTLIFE